VGPFGGLYGEGNACFILSAPITGQFSESLVNFQDYAVNGAGKQDGIRQHLKNVGKFVPVLPGTVSDRRVVQYMPPWERVELGLNLL
jgi:hypothetical protein